MELYCKWQVFCRGQVSCIVVTIAKLVLVTSVLHLAINIIPHCSLLGRRKGGAYDLLWHWNLLHMWIIWPLTIYACAKVLKLKKHQWSKSPNFCLIYWIWRRLRFDQPACPIARWVLCESNPHFTLHYPGGGYSGCTVLVHHCGTFPLVAIQITLYNM